MTDPRVALVMGASAGVGRKVSLDLADRHWRVAVCYRDQHFEAALVVRDLMAVHRREAQPIDVDLADPVAVARVVKYLEARWRAIDAVIWAPTPADLPPASAPDPLAALVHAVAPGMVARGFGRVVSLVPAAATVAALAAELGGGPVTVNQVSPDGVGAPDAGGLRPIPAGYLPGVDDVARAVRFFTSDVSAALTGANLLVERDWRDEA